MTTVQDHTISSNKIFSIRRIFGRTRCVFKKLPPARQLFVYLPGTVFCLSAGSRFLLDDSIISSKTNFYKSIVNKNIYYYRRSLPPIRYILISKQLFVYIGKGTAFLPCLCFYRIFYACFAAHMFGRMSGPYFKMYSCPRKEGELRHPAG